MMVFLFFFSSSTSYDGREAFPELVKNLYWPGISSCMSCVHCTFIMYRSEGGRINNCVADSNSLTFDP